MSRVTIAQIDAAIQLEKKDPHLALQRYKELDERNRAFRPNIFVASIIFPLIGAALTYYAIQVVDRYHTLIAFALLCLSFGPAFMRLTAAVVEMGLTEPPEAAKNYYNFFVMPYLVILGDALQILMIGIMALICTYVVVLPIGGVIYLLNGPPFIWPEDMPFMLTNGTAGIFTLFWMGLTFSNLSFHNLLKEPFSETLSMIPIGIARHTKDILQIFGSALLGLLVAGVGPLGIVYDSLWQYLLMISVTGLLLGSNISRPDDPRMTPLITLGLSRSHLALGHTLRARYLATHVMSGKNTFGYEQLDWLAEVQRELLSAGRNLAIIEELAILSVDSLDNFENSGESWPWQEALAILQDLAVKIKHQNTSIRLKTALAASSVLITAIIGGLALAYLAMINQAY